MKLATLKNGTRDGELIVVNKMLTQAVKVSSIAKTMQYAIDNWHSLSAELQKVYDKLNQNQVKDSFALDTTKLMAPLPRAYQWLDASAYVNHVELVRKSRGVEMPADFWTNPLMYQGGSDTFLGPNDSIEIPDEEYGIDFEAEVTVITDDVPMHISAEKAKQHIILIMLVNDVSLRNLAVKELTKGFGFVQSKPSSAFSPVAVTPDELGEAWDGARVTSRLYSFMNDKLFGQPFAGVDQTFSFPELISHAARTRALGAGTIVGSGTVSNKDRSAGSSCIVEKRTLEIIDKGEASTPYMHFGDKIKIEMRDKNENSIFGAIEQKVVEYKK
jgi:fumarylacetoacetate (FAA) hydrolase